MTATLNSGLNFIKHVDCGREMRKEAHKVLIEVLIKVLIDVDCGREMRKEAHKVLIAKQFKIVDFYCWLRKWELYYLVNMERQTVTFAI